MSLDTQTNKELAGTFFWHLEQQYGIEKGRYIHVIARSDGNFTVAINGTSAIYSRAELIDSIKQFESRESTPTQETKTNETN
jgi:hypothetical protein